MRIKESELILNSDGSLYHLNLKPEHIADTVLLVGDQGRVEKITRYFDHIEFETQKREFKTQTGTCNGRRLTVISTGIGPDNIDIVINEVDAAVNIDLAHRRIKDQLKPINFIRIGTSGSIHPEIAEDDMVLSTHGLDLNGMLHAYDISSLRRPDFEQAFIAATEWSEHKPTPLLINNSALLQEVMNSSSVKQGVTATAGGFYGPQGRVLRLALDDSGLNRRLETFSYKGLRIANFEMETSAIYGLCTLLGHRCLSTNIIVANRVTGGFSKNAAASIDKLIRYVLDRVPNLPSY